MQTEYVNALRDRAQADNRVLALWLEGSLGKNAGDQWSDVDAHILVQSDALPAFSAESETWLRSVQALVLFRAMFDGKMLNALTSGGLRVDVWLHANDEPTRLHPDRTVLLWEREPGTVVWDNALPAYAAFPSNVGALAERYINEFWRCIAILPSVLGRGEKIVAVLGFFAELSPLTDLLILGTGRPKDTGVKHLNRFLPGGAQEEIETALDLRGLTVTSLAQSHLALAAIMQKRGPSIAVQFGIPYPTDLEEAALRYVRQELAFVIADDQSITG